MSISAAIGTSMHLFADYGGGIRLYLSLRPGFDSRVMSTRLNAILSARNFLSSKMDG